MNDLIHDGNSILLVDHDTEIIKEAGGSLKWDQKQEKWRLCFYGRNNRTN